jgi:hypothetical protein
MVNTYNPILGKETFPRIRIFQPHPMPEPGVALVLYREGQNLVILRPGDRLTAGETRWGDYKTLYKVDVTEHAISITTTLPCNSDAFEFHADVQLTCCVDNPKTIIERNVTDAREVLEPLIMKTMRNISRNFEVEDSAAAENALIDYVLKAAVTYDVGLKINRFVVKLSLEADAREHLRKLRQIEREKEREKKTAELDKLKDELVIERKKFKMEFYAPLIREGHWQLLALQLSDHPEDIAAVAQMLSQQRQADMENQLKALKIMLEEDVIEGFQIEDAGKRVLQRFVESFGPVVETKALAEGEEKKKLPDKKRSGKPEKREVEHKVDTEAEDE